MDVFNFKCKFCGGELVQIDGLKSVGKCKYCGSKQTLPKLENEKRANLFERANHLRRNNEFDKAEALYEQLLNEDLSDPEAYWSLVLCRYGIEYVEDKRTGGRIPTINRMQMTSILGDEDYKSAIANADDEQRKLYEEEAKLINEIQKGIMEIARKEEPFDIFICYKETDSEGRRSRDSILAQDLYHELTRDGYKVFFARVTLQGKLGSAYEPYIFSALNSSKVMVVLGTKKEHFEAIWVRNEWSRFLGQIKKGERKVLIPAYRDMDAYDLPVEFSNLQALDMSRLGFLQELVEGVENILKAYKKKEASAKEPVPSPIPTKKKSKAVPIIIISLLLAIAIGAAAVFGSGILGTLPGGETDTTEPVTEVPTEEKTEAPTQSTTERETEESRTETGTETDTEINTENPDEIAVENPVSVIEEGVAYFGALAHKNLGKIFYLSGRMYNEYYLAESDNKEEAAKVYFEKSPVINYFMYFIDPTNGLRSYINVYQNGEYLDLGIDLDPITEWHFNSTYNCLMANINGELVFLGTSDTGTYDNVCVKRISDGPTYFKVELIKAETGTAKNQLSYQLASDGNGYIVTGAISLSGANLEIPATYNGKPVRCIAAGAFRNNTTITSVKIPRSIVAIGDGAFEGVSNLQTFCYEGFDEEWAEIYYPTREQEINENVYFDCLASTHLVKPDTKDFYFVYDSDGLSFYVSGIRELADIDYNTISIPSTYKGLPVIGICDYAFSDDDQIRTVFIPDSIKNIGVGAFDNVWRLTRVLYGGNSTQWDMIAIREGNEALNTDQNHFNVTVDGEWTLIGDIEDTNWSVDFMMTQKGTNVWLSDYLTLDAGNELKVRLNGEWVIDFGMTLGGENYVVKESGVYQIKFVYDPVRMTGEITLIPQKTSDGDEIACKHTSTYIDTGDNCNLKCTACGYTVEEGRHESIKEYVEIPPTENAHGSMTRMCEACGWKETVTIPPLESGGGDGETGTFDVANADQFVSLINRINSGEVANNVTINITGDIDMIGVSFTPIKEFRGVIEGNGWCIMNVELTANGEYVNVTDGNGMTYNSMMVGIISKAYGVSVRSLNLDNINANITTSGNMYIGALAGYADGLVVEDCTVSSILVLNETSNPGSTGVAGLVGYSRDALVQGVTLSARIDHTARSGESHTGAVLGAGNVRIHDCTIDLEITFVEESGAGHVGWLAGREYTDPDVDVSTLQGSTVTGTFSARTNWYAWGAVGQGYFYLEHGGGAMDLEQYNTRIDVRVIG